MSVSVRQYRSGGWEVDILLTLPDGTKVRERKKAPVRGRSAAIRWGQARERELLLHGRPAPKAQVEVSTLAAFAPRFLTEYAEANRHKPSGVASKERILRLHLLPLLGTKRLDAITTEDVQRLKHRLRAKSAKTVNNVLTVLGRLLRVAVDWGVLEHVPCSIRLLKLHQPEAAFHDFDEYARLLAAARSISPTAHVIALLGGDAGLRCGEIMGLEWGDVDLGRRQLAVRRSIWEGQTTTPKGGRPRVVPLTLRLTGALRAHRQLGRPVLCQQDGSPLTRRMVQNLVKRASVKAGLANTSVHALRHTFCSHLAMRGAPARAIQDLAGHRDLTTTQRYMHLSPRAIEDAIRLLDRPLAHARGDIVETGAEERFRRASGT